MPLRPLSPHENRDMHNARTTIAADQEKRRRAKSKHQSAQPGPDGAGGRSFRNGCRCARGEIVVGAELLEPLPDTTSDWER